MKITIYISGCDLLLKKGKEEFEIECTLHAGDMYKKCPVEIDFLNPDFKFSIVGSKVMLQYKKV